MDQLYHHTHQNIGLSIVLFVAIFYLFYLLQNFFLGVT